MKNTATHSSNRACMGVATATMANSLTADSIFLVAVREGDKRGSANIS
jgi:hypothetical protein